MSNFEFKREFRHNPKTGADEFRQNNPGYGDINYMSEWTPWMNSSCAVAQTANIHETVDMDVDVTISDNATVGAAAMIESGATVGFRANVPNMGKVRCGQYYK